jgi:hypothetical protein
VTNTSDPLAGNALAASAGADLLQAVSYIDAYQASPLHVTGVDANLQIRRGRRQAYLRSVRLPRRARAGARVRATIALQHVGGRLERRTVRLRLPRDLGPGRRRVVLTGTDVDLDAGITSEIIELDFDVGGGGGRIGTPNVRALAAKIERITRYDGVSARRAGPSRGRGKPAYRDPGLRISGRVRATVRITR